MKVYTLNAFTKDGEGGNPAAVVLEADSLLDKEMQEIARKIGFSETAFIQKSDKADYKVRFFTPDGEVDLCGHATIATFYLLAQKGLKEGLYKQETKAGILDIEVKKDKIFMNQNLPEFFQKLEKKEIAESLNISEDIISSDYPIQIVSTGLRDVLIPIKSLSELLSIKPDFNKVKEISKKYDIIAYHLFSLETKFGSAAHCRNLAPLYGIPEESATGTSNGALACYLYKYDLLINTENLVFEQGYSMNKPSEIIVYLKTDESNFLQVKVGGSASNIQEREITK
jgi:PhzF family phenazine biosynthesis protein